MIIWTFLLWSRYIEDVHHFFILMKYTSRYLFRIYFANTPVLPCWWHFVCFFLFFVFFVFLFIYDLIPLVHAYELFWLLIHIVDVSWTFLWIKKNSFSILFRLIFVSEYILANFEFSNIFIVSCFLLFILCHLFNSSFEICYICYGVWPIILYPSLLFVSYCFMKAFYMLSRYASSFSYLLVSINMHVLFAWLLHLALILFIYYYFFVS